MADNTVLSAPSGTGDTIRDKDRVTAKTQIVGLDLNIGGGSESLMTGTMPTDPTSVAVADGGTLPSKGVQVGGTDGTVFQVLSTDAAGRLNTNVNGTVPVSGPLTDAQLRAATVPVSGTVTASGPLTDTQLRTTPVPISGTVTANGAVTNAGTFAVQDSQKVIDNAAFTDGTTPVQPAGYIFDEVAGTALTENDAAAARIDSKRAQVGVLEDATTRGQRAAVSAAGALKVDNSAVTQPVSGTVTATGPLTDVQLRATAVPVSGTVTASGPLTDAQLRATAVPVSGTVTASGPLTDAQLRATAVPTSLATLPALVAGTAMVGQVNVSPQTANGLSIFHLVSAATTNATNLKASAGQVYGWYIYNSNAAARKVAFHNTAGTPTAGASVVFAIVIPPTSGANVEFTNGIAFGTGIAITTVTDLTDAGATAVALNDLVINIFFK